MTAPFSTSANPRSPTEVARWRSDPVWLSEFGRGSIDSTRLASLTDNPVMTSSRSMSRYSATSATVGERPSLPDSSSPARRTARWSSFAPRGTLIDQVASRK